MSYFVFCCLLFICKLSVLIISVREEIPFFLQSITCNYVVSVRRGFPFLLVLEIGCVILLWHSLGIPYNHSGNLHTI